LVGRDTIREAKCGKDGRGLTLPPLSNREDREMVGKQSGDGEGEDGSEGEAATVRAARIGNACEGGEEIEGREREHRRSGVLPPAGTTT